MENELIETPSVIRYHQLTRDEFYVIKERGQ